MNSIVLLNVAMLFTSILRRLYTPSTAWSGGSGANWVMIKLLTIRYFFPSGNPQPQETGSQVLSGRRRALP